VDLIHGSDQRDQSIFFDRVTVHVTLGDTSDNRWLTRCRRAMAMKVGHEIKT